MHIDDLYEIGFEIDNVAAFLAGNLQDPEADEGLAYWIRQITAPTAEGKTIARVRVVDEPPTDYQRWEHWVDKWNVEAGEQIRYLTRSRAAELPPSPFGDLDWWIFDDTAVLRCTSTRKVIRRCVALVIVVRARCRQTNSHNFLQRQCMALVS